MALDFPASPNINDTYTSGGVTWTWDGTTWKVLGRFQFTSSETDPVFTASPAGNILSSHITNWDTSYGWGDHSAAGYLTTTGSIGSHTDVTTSTLQDDQLLKYSVGNAAWENWTPNFLTSYTETDPVFSASAAAGITGTNIANWNTAYNWGDHSTAGYLTSLGDAAGVTTAKITNWDTAYGWGDHSAGGYLTTLALNGVSDVTITSPQNNDVLTYNGTGWVNAAPTGGGGGANVTISDTIPAGTPSAGDLWWESDSGRLKVYYTDTDSSQWVDASPPLADPNALSQTTTNGTNGITITSNTGGANANAIEFKTDNGTTSANRWRFVPNGHLLPTSNADYDIGNAEYKVRHLFLSDNTVYFEGSFLKVAQHDAGGAAQAASYLIPLSKLKDALNASADYEAFKTAILAITDA